MPKKKQTNKQLSKYKGQTNKKYYQNTKNKQKTLNNHIGSVFLDSKCGHILIFVTNTYHV